MKDVIVGKIYFLLVRIKIKHMEIAIIKRETTGSGPHVFTENETIAKYEIMDGAPVKGESIPIRVFLAGYDLTPTMRDINKKFSVRYFLNLVLMDTEDRRYFKQQEIILWRKSDKMRKPLSSSQSQGQMAAGSLAAPTNLVGQDGNLIQKTDEEKAAQARAHAAAIDSNLSSPVGTFDPTVGLFTEESPQQGRSSQSDDNHHVEDDGDITTTEPLLSKTEFERVFPTVTLSEDISPIPFFFAYS